MKNEDSSTRRPHGDFVLNGTVKIIYYSDGVRNEEIIPRHLFDSFNYYNGKTTTNDIIETVERYKKFKEFVLENVTRIKSQKKAPYNYWIEKTETGWKLTKVMTQRNLQAAYEYCSQQSQ